MAVLQMQRISICALKKDRKAILERLQSMGTVEMNQIAEDEAGFEKMDTLNARQGFEKKAQLSENALAVLDVYAPEKHSLLSGLEGKKLIGKKDFQESVGEFVIKKPGKPALARESDKRPAITNKVTAAKAFQTSDQ